MKPKMTKEEMLELIKTADPTDSTRFNLIFSKVVGFTGIRDLEEGLPLPHLETFKYMMEPLTLSKEETVSLYQKLYKYVDTMEARKKAFVKGKGDLRRHLLAKMQVTDINDNEAYHRIFFLLKEFFTVEELAEGVGTSLPTIERYQAGTTVPFPLIRKGVFKRVSEMLKALEIED